MNDEKKNISLGTLISYINVVVAIVFSFFTTRVVLSSLGEVNTSIRNISDTIIWFLGIVSLGLSSSYLRFRKVYFNKYGVEGEKKINSIFLICYTFFGIIALLIGFGFLFIARSGFIKVADEGKAYLLTPIIIINVISSAFSFPLSVFSFGINYNKKFVFISLVNLLDTILLPLSTILCLKIFSNNSNADTMTIVVSIIAVVESVLIKIIFLFYSIFKLKEKFSYKVSREDLKIIKPLISFSFFVFVVNASSILHNTSDQFILSSILNTSVALIYSYSSSFMKYSLTLTTTVSAFFKPRITASVIDNDLNDQNRILKLNSGIMSIILMLILGGFILSGKDFIFSWLISLESTSYKNDTYFCAILLIFSVIMTAYTNFLYNYEVAACKHKFAAFVHMGSVVANIFLNIGLCALLKKFNLGIYGIVIATVICNIGEVILISVYSKKNLKLDVSIYFKYLTKNFFICLLVLIPLYFLFYFIRLSSISYFIRFLIKAISFLILYVGMELIFNKKFIFEFVKMLKRK